MKSTIVFATFLVALGIALAEAGEEKIVHGADHFSFAYQTTLPSIRGHARLWIPLARSDRFQDVTIDRVATSLSWRKVTDQSGLNDILIAEPSSKDAGTTIEVDYTVTRREKAVYADDVAAEPALAPDRLVPRDAEFEDTARRVVAERKPDITPGRALYDHVLLRMRYDKQVQGSGRGDALFAAKSCAGNCTDFHSYFIALARAAGIPARFEIGSSIPADRQNGTIQGYHCWAEYWANGKWVPVDISEASKNPELAEYYYGHAPANRFELSRGRDLQVDPAPASGPINFLIYPLLELDGEPVPVQTEFTFRR